MKQIINTIIQIFGHHLDEYKGASKNQITVCNYSNNYYQDKVCHTGHDDTI